MGELKKNMSPKKHILYQGSTGTFGDFFLSTHPMAHCFFDNVDSIWVALNKKTPDIVKDLYKNVTFLSGIIELDDITSNSFEEYCNLNHFEPCYFINTFQFNINNSFYPLKKWFQYKKDFTLVPDRYIGFQVASSSNYIRPAIPYLNIYLELIIKQGYKPVFMGSKQDESVFNRLYPGLKEKYNIEENLWRFGKDTLYQSLSNITLYYGMLTFSSWTAYAAVLQGIPCIELWSTEQWLIYTPRVRRFLGDPVHYCQDYYIGFPTKHLIQVFTHLRSLASSFYAF